MNEEVKERPSCFWRGKQYWIEATRYAENEHTCLVLMNSMGEMQLKATVNIAGTILPPDHFYIKNYSENAGIAEALEKAGLVEATGSYVSSGHVRIKLYAGTPRLCDALGIPMSPGPLEDPEPEAAEPSAAADDDQPDLFEEEMPADATAGIPDPEDEPSDPPAA